MDANEVSVLLGRIASHFEQAEQRGDIAGAADATGWGQFLDDPKSHRQIGPYGTSAGLIVCALAGRGSQALDRVSGLARAWWLQWKEKEHAGRRLFCQTPRLAFFWLGLRLSQILDETTRDEVEHELLVRMLPDGMWGNYFSSSAFLDRTPRLFCSSIALLSLTLLNTNLSATETAQLESAARGIENSLLGNKELPLLHAAAGIAGVLSFRRGRISPKLRKLIRRVAWSTHPNLSDLGVYFYDFADLLPGGDVESGRDYFIVPSEILLAIAGMLEGAPLPLRQRAESTTALLRDNINANQGAYRSDPEQRLSSKNQAWAALLLHLAVANRPAYAGFAKIWYELKRQREGNWFSEVGFPLFSIVAITVEIVVFRGFGPVVNVMTGIGGVIVSALYGSVLIKKWFPGR